jgi:hypothetical protein
MPAPYRLLALTSCAAPAAILTASVASAAPILEYQFETLASTGTDTTPVTLLSGAAQSAAGTGVTGGLGLPMSPTDRAFSGTTGSSRAAQSADNDSIDGLVSFTLSGWYKTSALGGRFLHNPSDFELIPGAGSLTLSVDSANASAGGAFPQNNEWSFFAITYDGTQTAGNVKYYAGYRTDAEAQAAGAASAGVQLVATASRNAGPTNDNTGALLIGNRNNAGAFDRAYVGLLDNLRIDGSKAAGDAGGALTLAELDARRLGDVTVVPEPVGLPAVAVASGLLAARRWRRGA